MNRLHKAVFSLLRKKAMDKLKHYVKSSVLIMTAFYYIFFSLWKANIRHKTNTPFVAFQTLFFVFIILFITMPRQNMKLWHKFTHFQQWRFFSVRTFGRTISCTKSFINFLFWVKNLDNAGLLLGALGVCRQNNVNVVRLAKGFLSCWL